MRYWTYRIIDSRGMEAVEYTGTGIEKEKDARKTAVNDVQKALSCACEDMSALFPVTIVLRVHTDEMTTTLGEERYNKKEISGFGKEKDLSFGELLTLAKENYAKGGDVIYECWDQNFYDDYVKECGPVKRKDVKKLFSLLKEILKNNI